MFHYSFILSVLIIGTHSLFLTNDRPHHASCKVDWFFGLECSDVQIRLKSQIQQWSASENCHNDKCNYQILQEDANILRAKHRATSFRYVNDLTFTFLNDTNGCKVHGFSSAEDPLAYFDGSTNYCGMHTLITGSSLNQSKEYDESTSDKICTQYSEANCS
ncbi:uncharacterized protein LOC133193607 [Saccostrea echinata]|uniref:uncharacterized protein LOC133193607 n=1 Tax=Saccostrea echinata TaxID=191078 RepID=UPI002A839750|nr:uncharacterized protein LOC133193607 [Saccostrea echinata]